MKEYTCPRCAGNKYIEKFKHVEGGVCFECYGKGTVTEEEKNRILKVMATEKKRANTIAKNQKEKLLKSLKKQWFNNADTIYIINEANTFEIKDQLKNDGAKFNYGFKTWYFTEPKKNYNTFSINWNEILESEKEQYASSLRKLIQERSSGILKGY